MNRLAEQGARTAWIGGVAPAAALVARAGGLTPRAYPEGIRFVRPQADAGRINIEAKTDYVALFGAIAQIVASTIAIIVVVRR